MGFYDISRKSEVDLYITAPSKLSLTYFGVKINTKDRTIYRMCMCICVCMSRDKKTQIGASLVAQ